MSDVTCASPAEAAALVSRSASAERPAWPAIVSLALGVFGLVTAEFLPASILTPIARDLGISDGLAGQTVTATAVVGAFAGPAIVIGAGRIDRRLILFTLTSLLVVSSLLAAFASHVAVLLGARVLLGIALGGFWSLSAALAIRLVSLEKLPRAMAIIFTGVSAATVCAAPVGAYLGDLFGWRSAFGVAAVLGIVALVAQLATVPSLPASEGSSLGTLWRVLKNGRVRLGLVTILLVISGHFAGFTYVRPFLEQVTQLNIEMISALLLAFGIAGFFGNLVGGWIAARSARIDVGLASILLSAMAFALIAYGASVAVAFVAVGLWGFAFGGLPVGLQTWNTQSAPDDAESAGALLVTTFQVAIASGAVFGGLLVDGLGAAGPIAYCAVAVLAGGFGMLTFGRKAVPASALTQGA